MNRKKWMLAAGVTLAGVMGGAGAVTATTADDTPLTGEKRDKAVAAAVSHVGGGEVTETELGDNGSGYGVEVRKPDGSQVEVNLDQNYAVTSAESDDDGPDDDGANDDVNDDDGPNDPDDDPGEPASGADD